MRNLSKDSASQRGGGCAIVSWCPYLSNRRLIDMVSDVTRHSQICLNSSQQIIFAAMNVHDFSFRYVCSMADVTLCWVLKMEMSDMVRHGWCKANSAWRKCVRKSMWILFYNTKPERKTSACFQCESRIVQSITFNTQSCSRRTARWRRRVKCHMAIAIEMHACMCVRLCENGTHNTQHNWMLNDACHARHSLLFNICVISGSEARNNKTAEYGGTPIVSVQNNRTKI